MSDCCDPSVLNNPCAAIADGSLNIGNYAKYGLSKAQWMLLTAQCGTTNAIVDLTDVLDQILACCTAANLILQDIDDNTDGLETQMAALIVLVTSGNATRDDILTAVEAILVEAIAINANTDTLEALLGTIITLTTTIGTDQNDPNLFGTHAIATGTQAGAPAAGPYYSWVVVRTGGTGALTVDGILLVNTGDSTAEEAQPQFQVPAPVIVVAVDAEYVWRTKS